VSWSGSSKGHIFLHCGLSDELSATAEEQLAALHRKQSDRSILKPQLGTATDRLWQPEYPVWLGADKGLSDSPLAFPGKVQVTGHVKVREPDVNSARIRLDTSGGECPPLTACMLRSTHAEPVFILGNP
jgi:serine/threonine protein phosphatase 1